MTRKQINNRILFWAKEMQMGNWSFTYSFKKVKSDNETENFSAVAQIDANPFYKLASMKFDPETLDLVSDTTIVHELYHALMAELTEYAEERMSDREKDEFSNLKERLTTELERITMRLYERTKNNRNKNT